MTMSTLIRDRYDDRPRTMGAAMDSAEPLTSFYSTFYSEPPQLLLVDDDADQTEMLSAILVDAGFEPTTAGSAEEAVVLCANRPFDLCVIDWKLPGMPGHQLIGEIKMLNPSCPCILLTGFPDFNLAQLAVNSGADGFVVKPVNPGFLLSLLEGALFHRLLVQERERFEGVLQTLRTFRHEIGNPLQGLLGNVELLTRRVPPDPSAARYIKNIRISADQILNLLDRLDELKQLTTRDSPVGSMLDLPRQSTLRRSH
jgi:CheY-like chemotaxis protein